MFENPRFVDSTALNQVEGFIPFLSIFSYGGNAKSFCCDSRHLVRRAAWPSFTRMVLMIHS